MLSYAIVRKPCKNFQNGISTSNLGKPNYNKAIHQHLQYIKALIKCGLRVIELDADERFPDSTFVEDTAVVNEDLAIITNLGVKSRKGEEIEIKKVLERFFNTIESIKEPGTLEGGDIMRIDNHYFIGLSKRTNKEGGNQFIEIVEKFGYSCSIVPLSNVLHLKTGVSYIGDGNLIASGEFIKKPQFKDFNLIELEENVSYAANSLRINDYVLIPKGFNNLKKKLLNIGYSIKELDMSEFRKMDGGLSCLSIRF
jgi:dimethylargininase